MFALAVELLGGRYVATAYNDRDSAEWPPHPARFFSALVATLANADLPDPGAARRALEWLEQLPAPEILASAEGSVARRSVVPVFVPVNDGSTVAAPDSVKLAAARERLALSAGDHGSARLAKDVERLEQKLLADTAKAIAIPAKYGKENPGAHVLPEARSRQPRTFPSVAPDEPRFAFVWSDANPPRQVADALGDLASRLVRLGHSSTLVRVHSPDARELEALARSTNRYRPDEQHGKMILRWVAAGQLSRLDRAFELHRETEPRVLPARFVRYSTGEEVQRSAISCSVFEDEFIVFARVGGPRLPITSVAGVARQFRRALMSTASPPIPELLSGHGIDGSPSASPHLAVVPLPFVGHRFSDGALLGIALALPRTCDAAQRRSTLIAVGRLEESHAAGAEFGATPVVPLRLGASGVLELQRVVWGHDARSTLQPWRWTGPARRWASATPVALDLNPGDLHDRDVRRRAAAFEAATESVKAAIERIGLPVPLDVEVVRSCVLAGTAKPRVFPRFPCDESKTQRVLVHVRLDFGVLVRGPILLGAGRYQGLGLLWPLDPGDETVAGRASERSS
jgi:CRISPR-associated protein Csb2